MIDWPDNLINDLARRRAVVVIGSGVSRQSENPLGNRPPVWHSFLDKALTDRADHLSLAHIRNAIDTGDYLHACEWLKKHYDEAWNGYLRTIFQEPGFNVSDLHRKIVEIDSRIVFSLNFDDIYERTANEIKRGSHVVKHYYDNDVSEFLRGDGRYIVKIHGGLNSPDNVIFTQADYARARIKHSSFYQAFDACLLTHSFLFIGAGYSNPDINLILENQAFGFPTSSPHYFLSSDIGHDDRKSSLRQNRNLKTIIYDKMDDDHTGLVTEITSLVEKIDEKRQDLALYSSW